MSQGLSFFPSSSDGTSPVNADHSESLFPPTHQIQLAMDNPPFDKRWLLSKRDLVRVGIHLSNSTLLRMEKNGSFPRRIRLSAYTPVWSAQEIRDHLVKLAIAREAA